VVEAIDCASEDEVDCPDDTDWEADTDWDKPALAPEVADADAVLANEFD
jgi:hypothetical protein